MYTALALSRSDTGCSTVLIPWVVVPLMVTSSCKSWRISLPVTLRAGGWPRLLDSCPVRRYHPHGVRMSDAHPSHARCEPEPGSRRDPIMAMDTFLVYVGVYERLDDAVDRLRGGQGPAHRGRPHRRVRRGDRRASRRRQGQDRQEARDADPRGWRARRRRRPGDGARDRAVPGGRDRRRPAGRHHRRRCSARRRGRPRRRRHEPQGPQGARRATRRGPGGAGRHCGRRTWRPRSSGR